MYVPGFDPAAFTAVCRAMGSALGRLAGRVGCWLVTAFAAAGCWSCGYVAYGSWCAVSAPEHGPRKLPLSALPDAGDDLAVRRYAARGIRELETYLAATAPDRSANPGDAQAS